LSKKAFETDIRVGIRAIGNIKGVLPLDIETVLFDSFFVREVMHLLQDHQANHAGEFFRRSSVIGVVMLSQDLYRKFCEDFLAE